MRDSPCSSRVAGGAALALPLCLALDVHAATYHVGPGKPYASPGEVADLLAPGDVVELDGDATYTGGIAFWEPGNRGPADHDSRHPRQRQATGPVWRHNDHRGVRQTTTSSRVSRSPAEARAAFTITPTTSRCAIRSSTTARARHARRRQRLRHLLTMEYVEVYACGGGTQHHQIYMATDETTYPGSVFRMQHCYVHDGNGGNNVKSAPNATRSTHNWIEGALYHELELIGPDGQDPALAREDSDVVGNVLVKTRGRPIVRASAATEPATPSGATAS